MSKQSRLTEYFTPTTNRGTHTNNTAKLLLSNDVKVVSSSSCENATPPSSGLKRPLLSLTVGGCTSKRPKSATRTKKSTKQKPATDAVKMKKQSGFDGLEIHFRPSMVRRLDFGADLGSSTKSTIGEGKSEFAKLLEEKKKMKETLKDEKPHSDLLVDLDIDLHVASSLPSTSTITTTVKSDVNNNSSSGGEESEVKKTKTILAVEEIKEKLKGCTKLDALKQQLANINGCAEQLRRFKEMKVRYNTPTQSPHPKSPKSPRKNLNSPQRLVIGNITPRNLFASPVKASPSSSSTLTTSLPVPAYKKFQHLVAPKKSLAIAHEAELPLPCKYQRLVDVFKKVDHYAWALFKRHESCTYEKLKIAVEQGIRRTFDLDHLLSLLAVAPNQFFKLTQHIIETGKKIVITPVYHDSVKCLNSVSVLLEREQQYRSLLLERTKEEHLKFLASMSLTLQPEKQIYRWHPMFPLDSVPDIAPDRSLLPKPTHKRSSILNYVQLPLSNTQVSTPESPNKENRKVNETSKGDKVVNGLLKGISLDLLNKVRAKEAAKLAKQMTQSPSVEREIRDLARLPDLIRVLHGAFLLTTARCISFHDALEKIIDSTHLGLLEAERLLHYLTTVDVAKCWLEVIHIKNAQYLRIDRDYPLANLFRAIRLRMQRLQNS